MRSARIPVRRATPEDAAELVRLRTVMLGSLGKGDDGAWQPYARQLLRRRLGEDGPADSDLAAFVVDRPVAAGGDDPPPGTDDPAAAAPARAGRAPAACAVGTVEHRLPGPHSPLGLVDWAFNVFNVVTDPELRRRGYARACMTALLAWYGEREVHRIDLLASGQGAALYETLGFVRKAYPAMRLDR